MGDRNIQGCDQHKEATQSHICVLSSFTWYMMVTVTTMKATILKRIHRYKRLFVNYLFKIYI
jgi:hypothetical protein